MSAQRQERMTARAAALEATGFPGDRRGIRLEDLPRRAAKVVRSAVHPLEIAAALESCGLSDGVVRQRFGEASLFSAAERLYRATPLRPVGAEASRAPRPGGAVDLARGLMFALPCLVCIASASALRLRLPWWPLPLALVTGWGSSQAIASMLSFLRATAFDGRAAVSLMLCVSAVTIAPAALAGMEVFGGGAIAVETAMALSLYVTLCSVLLAHDEAPVMAAALAPAAVVAGLYYVLGRVEVPGMAVGIAAACTGAVTLAATLRHAAVRRHPLAGLGWSLCWRSAGYYAYGAFCGLGLSCLVVLATSDAVHGSWMGTVSVPVLVSLGPMEWQIRSYRANAHRELGRATTVELFARSAQAAFTRAIGIYLAVLLAASLAVGGLIDSRGHGLPVLVLGSELTLGAVYFCGLVLGCCDRVDLLVRSWAAGLVLMVLCVVGELLVAGHLDPHVVRAAFGAAVLVVLALLLAEAWRLASRPFNHT